MGSWPLSESFCPDCPILYFMTAFCAVTHGCSERVNKHSVISGPVEMQLDLIFKMCFLGPTASILPRAVLEMPALRLSESETLGVVLRNHSGDSDGLYNLRTASLKYNFSVSQC